MRQMKVARAVVLASCVLLAWLVWLCLLRPVHYHSRAPEMILARNAQKLGNALRQYREAHKGGLPCRLSELVPDYVGLSNTVWFCVPGTATKSFEVASSDAPLGAIDERGAFVYIGERGIREDLVLFARPSLWCGQGPTASVVVVDANLTVKLRSVEYVERRIARLLTGCGTQSKTE